MLMGDYKLAVNRQKPSTVLLENKTGYKFILPTNRLESLDSSDSSAEGLRTYIGDSPVPGSTE